MQIRSEEDNNQYLQRNNAVKVVVGAVGLAGVAIAVTEEPAHADAIADLTTTVTSLGTLAAAALVVALVPFGIYYGFRIIKKAIAGGT
jgi:predicted ATP-grasp superfamily ATP-dependent carboligase